MGIPGWWTALLHAVILGPRLPVSWPHHRLGPHCHLPQAGGKAECSFGRSPSLSHGTHRSAHILRRGLGHMATPNGEADGTCSRAGCQGKVEHGFGGTVSSLRPRESWEPSWRHLPGSAHPSGRHVSRCSHRVPSPCQVLRTQKGVRRISPPKCRRRGRWWAASITEAPRALCSTRGRLLAQRPCKVGSYFCRRILVAPMDAWLSDPIPHTYVFLNRGY